MDTVPENDAAVVVGEPTVLKFDHVNCSLQQQYHHNYDVTWSKRADDISARQYQLFKGGRARNEGLRQRTNAPKYINKQTLSKLHFDSGDMLMQLKNEKIFQKMIGALTSNVNSVPHLPHPCGSN